MRYGILKRGTFFILDFSNLIWNGEVLTILRVVIERGLYLIENFNWNFKYENFKHATPL